MLAASKYTTESLWIPILEITLTPEIFVDEDSSSAVPSRLPFSLLFLFLKLLQYNYTVTVDETHLSSIGSLYSKSFLVPNAPVPFLPMLCAQLLCNSASQAGPIPSAVETSKNSNRDADFQPCIYFKFCLLFFLLFPLCFGVTDTMYTYVALST